MNVQILMVTHGKDLAFAKYAVKAIEKFATGFGPLVVVVPERDRLAFEKIAKCVVGFSEREAKGMLHHMGMICMADDLLPNADAILHLDADCLFTEPVTPADYIIDGKPVLVRQAYESFKEYKTRYSWKKCVQAATGIDPIYETMCRHPSVHLPCTYQKTRELIEKTTGQNWMEYILSCRNEFPQTFAEFPTLGAVAYEHFRDLYHWIDVENIPKSKVKEFWSHGGLQMKNDRHPDQTALEVIEGILK